MSRSRSFLVGCFILTWFATTVAHAQYPYEGVVTTKARVRSGPSEAHYTTGILEPDARVIVVREAAPGWLAIKPPHVPSAESFSWISGEYVKEVGNSEGEVTGDNVQVRIGTPIDDRHRDYPQIELRRGDRVRIRDRKTFGEGPLAKLWYKIDPPKGEVRFISAQLVQPAGGRRPTPRTTPADATSTPKPLDPATQQRDYPTGKSLATDPTDQPDDDEREKLPTDNSSRGLLERADAAFKAMMQKSLPNRDIAKVRALYEQAAQGAKHDADHAIIARRLEELQDQEDRKAKLEEFERLIRSSKQRDEALLSMSRKKDDTPERPVPPYAGSGILRRSTATIDGKPAYVLVSPQGGIRYYVTPSPGLDLKKYVDQTVAVRGPVAYRPEVRKEHITVRDVTPIDVRR